MKHPDTIELNDLSKQFEYAKLCKEINQCSDIEELRDAFKCYLKLYFSTLEAITYLKNI